MGKFSFLNNTSDKIIEIKVEGMMSLSDANNFIEHYKNNISKIQPTQYILEFDCKELGVSTKDSAVKLNECFQLYKQDKFKKVVFNVGNNQLLKMQLTKMASSVNLSNYEFN